ncbi:lytic transglycosylase domain-containing protein [Rhodanobacter hydrolyticus]|uniref:Lytic transglycosylase domain-containing protein n=1 Tax=Rhodanobacter hydrolyticus TaxID=2250595 RepID=A0ABW8J7J9_9GAMM
MGLMACPNLAVSVEVMSHIVDVESGANPYAIGVVGGQLERQPKNLAEALATVHMLDAKGYNYSLGVAQVNRANLGKYGLDTYEKAFDACPNLAAGAQILAACYASSGRNWGKAFSCYYSGNFVTGYRDGYVQKVYDSINRDKGFLAGSSDSQAIPLKSVAMASADSADTISAPQPGSPDYRVAIRSVSFFSTKAYSVDSGSVALPNHAGMEPTIAAQGEAPKAAASLPAAASVIAAPVSTPTNGIPTSAATNSSTADSSIFVPQVTGPNDPTPSPAPFARPAASTPAASMVAGTNANATAAHAQEPGDAAFVF